MRRHLKATRFPPWRLRRPRRPVHLARRADRCCLHHAWGTDTEHTHARARIRTRTHIPHTPGPPRARHESLSHPWRCWLRSRAAAPWVARRPRRNRSRNAGPSSGLCRRWRRPLARRATEAARMNGSSAVPPPAETSSEKYTDRWVRTCMHASRRAHGRAHNSSASWPHVGSRKQDVCCGRRARPAAPGDCS